MKISKNTILAPDHYDLNRQQILQNLGDDEDLLFSLVDIFLANYHKDCNLLRNGIETKKNDDVQRAAHTLKGSLGHFCDNPCIQLAAQLEAAGKNSNFAEAQKIWPVFQIELQRLLPKIKALSLAKAS